MMTSTSEAAPTDTRSVDGLIRFTANDERWFRLNNDDYAASSLNLTAVSAPVIDAASLATPPSLAIEGFARVGLETDLAGVAESIEAQSRYIEEVGKFVRELMGADEVAMLPGAVIRRQQASPTRTTRSPVREHCFPPADTSGGRVVRRRAAITIWRKLSAGPTSRPLALCDARSPSAEDVIPGDSYFPRGSSPESATGDFTFEMIFVEHNEKQRWHYYPELAEDEVLVFSRRCAATPLASAT